MRHVKRRRAASARHDLADLAKQEPHDFGVRVFSVPRDHEVVAPSLTPESYNNSECGSELLRANSPWYHFGTTGVRFQKSTARKFSQ